MRGKGWRQGKRWGGRGDMGSMLLVHTALLSAQMFVLDAVPEEEEKEQEEVVVVFTRGNRGGSAQYATRATPTRSSHR